MNEKLWDRDGRLIMSEIAPIDLTPTLTDSQKINMNIITMNTALNDIQKDISILNKVILLGNGEPPLRETVRNHDAFLRDIRYWTRFVGGAIVIQTIAFTLGILVAVVKFLPILEQLSRQITIIK